MREFHDETWQLRTAKASPDGRSTSPRASTPEFSTALDFARREHQKGCDRKPPSLGERKAARIDKPPSATALDAAGATLQTKAGPWQHHQEKARAASSRTRPSRCPTPTLVVQTTRSRASSTTCRARAGASGDAIGKSTFGNSTRRTTRRI